jgi:hypothetical protein
MKKILGIIIFNLLFFSNAKAETCGFTWSIRDNPGLTIPYFVRFDFKNDTSDVAKISGVKLYTQSNKIVNERVFKKRGSDGKILEPKYVKPNSETMIAFNHGVDLPWDIIKKATIDCVVITYDQYEDELLGNIKTKQKKNETRENKEKFNWSNFFSFDLSGAFKLSGIGLIIYLVFIIITKLGDRRLNKLAKESRKSSSIQKGNILERVWEGKETMSKTFWLYCILVTLVVSFISGLLLAPLGRIIFIAPAIMIIWSNTGLWRSSEIYKNKKLDKKQTYGWATSAKVYVVLNYLTTLSQLGFILR